MNNRSTSPAQELKENKVINQSTSSKQESKEDDKVIIPFPTRCSRGTSLPNNGIAVTDQDGVLYIYDCLQANIKMKAIHPAAKNTTFQFSYLFGLPDGRVFYSFLNNSYSPANYIFDPATQNWLNVNSEMQLETFRRINFYSLNSQDIACLSETFEESKLNVFRISNGDFKSVFNRTLNYPNAFFNTFISLDDTSFLVTVSKNDSDYDESIILVKFKKSSSGKYKEENRNKIDNELSRGVGLNASELLHFSDKTITRYEYKSNKIEQGKNLPIQFSPDSIIKHPENKEGLILGLQNAGWRTKKSDFFFLNTNKWEIQYFKTPKEIIDVLPIGKSTFAALIHGDPSVHLFNPYGLAIMAEPVKLAIIASKVVCNSMAGLIAEYATDIFIPDKSISQGNRFKLFNTGPKSVVSEIEDETLRPYHSP